MIDIEQVATALGIDVLPGHRATCLHPERHKHHDAHPSVHIDRKRNKWKCFVCNDPAASNIDLVMEALHVDFPQAIRWICERFEVPPAKPGRPIGAKNKWQCRPLHAGWTSDPIDVIVRSGVMAKLTPAHWKVLQVLVTLREVDTNSLELSYNLIQHYTGLSSRSTISEAVRALSEEWHMIMVVPGPYIDGKRFTNRYILTFDDPRFIALRDQAYSAMRAQWERDSVFRGEERLRRKKECIALLSNTGRSVH